MASNYKTSGIVYASKSVLWNHCAANINNEIALNIFYGTSKLCNPVYFDALTFMNMHASQTIKCCLISFVISQFLLWNKMFYGTFCESVNLFVVFVAGVVAEIYVECVSVGVAVATAVGKQADSHLTRCWWR